MRHLLVATDFSVWSEEAVARAVALAREHDATLTLLHVLDINSPEGRTHCGTAQELMTRLRTAGLAGLGRIRQSLARGQVKARTLMLEGLPAEAIIQSSAGFDLLVMAKPPASSPWNLFSRHTVQCVIEQAQCPVLVVREIEREPVDRRFAVG